MFAARRDGVPSLDRLAILASEVFGVIVHVVDNLATHRAFLHVTYAPAERISETGVIPVGRDDNIASIFRDYTARGIYATAWGILIGVYVDFHNRVLLKRGMGDSATVAQDQRK